ncbi:MAG: BlaI/MecI/CopY family transcriptional regulator, partial [Bacteroidales bacterium]|nr:BlaI/MecI/CopY family transcriptional regulator [Bacteroidales bacterium]
MNDRIRRLPDAEQEVMQAIWACAAPVARTDIEEILFQEHPMAMTTLLTLLTR